MWRHNDNRVQGKAVISLTVRSQMDPEKQNKLHTRTRWHPKSKQLGIGCLGGPIC